MDDLIQHALRGLASDRDQRTLAQWRAASPENERRYQDLARIWELTGARHRPPAPSPASLIARARPPQRRWIPWAAAAALLLAALWGGWRLGPMGEVYAADSTALIVTLADGSLARLAPGSRFTYRAAKDARTVRLDGSAFFAVAQQPGQPFTVESGPARTTVLGTRFQVTERSDSVDVTVVQGAVSLATRGGSVRLERGDMGLAVNGHPPTRSSSPEDATPPLLYQRTPLGQVADELGRRFGRTVIVTDSTLAALPVTAWFEHEQFADAMTALCLITRARCVLDGTPARISP